MSTSGSDQGFNIPVVSSILSDPDASNTDNKEDDAALVDSFFLPGGLFSDEGGPGNESNVAKSNNNNLQLEPPRRIPVHLPNNPWETGNSGTMAEASTGIEPLSMQQLQSANHMNHDKYSTRPTQSIYSEATTTTNINHFPLNSQFRNDRTTLGSTTSAESDPFLPDLIFNQNQQQNVTIPSTTTTSKILRPPPGFQDGPTLSRSIDSTETMDSSSPKEVARNDRGNSMDFFASTTTSTEREYLFSSEDRMGTSTSYRDATTSDRYTNCPPTTFHHNTSLPTNHTIDSKIAQTTMNIPTRSVQSDEEGSNKCLAKNVKEQLSSKATPDCNSESNEADDAVMISMTDASSKATSQISKDCTEGGDYGDENDADVQDEEDENEGDEEENSIPSSICLSIAESNSSSLSTCSGEGDHNSELSNSSRGSGHVQHTHDDDNDDLNEGNDTDQAHVSEIVVEIGNNLSSSNGIPNDEKSQAPSENSAERTPPSTSDKFLHDDDKSSTTFTTEKLSALVRSVVESFDSIMDHSLSAMQRILSYTRTTKRYKRFSRQMELISQDFRSLRNWLVDMREVLSVLMMRLLDASQKHSRGMIEVVTVVLSFLFELLKFGLIEALEEFRGVTSCYMVFYLMPKTCVALMEYINLPHWTPHTVTWLAIFSLCQQVEAGILHETSNIPMPSLLRKLVIDSYSTKPAIISDDDVFSKSTKMQQHGPPPRQQHDALSRQKDMQVCFLLLKTIKTVLPVLYMVEGFSSDFGSIIGARGTDLLAMAFVLSILRKSILSSPIAWVSWAFQILLAAFSPSCTVLDILVLLIGLSSIRLIRFLDMQRKLGNSGVYERSHK